MSNSQSLYKALGRAGISVNENLSGCPICTHSRRSFLAALATLSSAGAATLLSPDTSDAAANRKAIGGPIIDIHAHMVDSQLLVKATGRAPDRTTPGMFPLMLDAEAQLRDMDRLGIDRHVVTFANAIQGITWGDARTDLDIHRRLNDSITEQWVGRHPTRFVGACTLPTQDLSLAIPELERCVTQLHMKMVQISSLTPDGIYYGDPRLRPFWDAVVHHDIPVFIHPHLNATEPPLDDFGMTNSIGQGIEEAKVMGSLIYQGIFDRYPSVKIIVAHGGGFLPHYYGRMDRNITNVPTSTRNIAKKPSEYLKSFYYDSCVYSPDILAALVKIVGSDRILLGSDYPVGIHDAVEELQMCKALSKNDVTRIAGGTAIKLLKLDA